MGTSEIPHISHIQTSWTVLRQALAGESGTQRQAALKWLEERYGRAVHRFLRKLAPELCDDLYQDFWTRVLERKYKRADPARGRFREYLKECLRNLVAKHWRRIRPTCHLPENWEPWTAETADDMFSHEWNMKWREELFDHADAELRSLQRRKQREGEDVFWYTVLKTRQEQPDLPSHELAPLIAKKLEKNITPGWVRKQLMHARKHFRQFLVDEIAMSLGEPDGEQIEAELAELGLRKYFSKNSEKKD